jgi:hypothetical protein
MSEQSYLFALQKHLVIHLTGFGGRLDNELLNAVINYRLLGLFQDFNRPIDTVADNENVNIMIQNTGNHFRFQPVPFTSFPRGYLAINNADILANTLPRFGVNFTIDDKSTP